MTTTRLGKSVNRYGNIFSFISVRHDNAIPARVRMHEIVRRVGCASSFQQQSDEKLNHAVTSTFFTATNLKDGKLQTKQRRTRVLKLRLNRCEPISSRPIVFPRSPPLIRCDQRPFCQMTLWPVVLLVAKKCYKSKTCNTAAREIQLWAQCDTV